MRGIDISNWQAGIIPAQTPIDFCICKATEGLNFVDEYCDGFIQNCIQNNILWGFYHFARENNPETEAQFFYDNCRNYFNHGIPVLDYEVNNWNNREWCERFINELHELTDVWCMLYISAGRCVEYAGSWIPEKCGLWVAGYPYPITNYDFVPEMPYSIYPWEFAAIWQFSDCLILPGYASKLDGDVAYMDREGWSKYAQSTDVGQNVENPTNGTKNLLELVQETLDGKYGSGEDRKRALGNVYDEVQNRINELYNIADEVIDGKWGNGWNRKNALEGVGQPYDIIQRIVNDKLS